MTSWCGLGLVLMLTACSGTGGHDCTAAAGSSSIALIPGDDDVQIESLCVANDCLVGNTFTQGSAASGFAISDEPATYPYSVRFVLDGETFTAEGLVDTVAWYPNGIECGPRKARALLRVFRDRVELVDLDDLAHR